MMLKDKVAIVTGGAQGIGEAIVRRYVEEGAKVVLVDILKTGEAVACELNSLGYEVTFVQADVSNYEEVQEAVDITYGRYGRIDILCNNAAINKAGSVIDMPVDLWERIIKVNLHSQMYFCKSVIPIMQKQGGGVIVNMASANSFVAEPHLNAYVTTKGGILAFTKEIAVTFASDNIRCNCICPGWVNTTLNDDHAEKYGGGLENVLNELPKIQVLGRPIEPIEIANPAVFLASDWSVAMTGSALTVDGGVTAM